MCNYLSRVLRISYDFVVEKLDKLVLFTDLAFLKGNLSNKPNKQDFCIHKRKVKSSFSFHSIKNIGRLTACLASKHTQK